MIKHVRPSST